MLGEGVCMCVYVCVGQRLMLGVTTLSPELARSVHLASRIFGLLPGALELHPPSIYIHGTRDPTPDNMLVQQVLYLLSSLVSP